MIELEQEMKDRLKQQRLEQYKMQLYSLQMDLAAYEAVGDEKMVEETKKHIEQGLKAYEAVERMN